MEDLISNLILPHKQKFSYLSMRLLSHKVAWVSCLVSNCKSSLGFPYFFFFFLVTPIMSVSFLSSISGGSWCLCWMAKWCWTLGVKPIFLQSIKITTFFLNPTFALSPWPLLYTSNKLKWNSTDKFYKYFHLLGTTLRCLHLNPYNAYKKENSTKLSIP